MHWLQTTLQTYPELAVFLALAIGYWFGGKSIKGFSLGAVTSTLLAAIIIGQLGIAISGNVKSIFFLMFLFAVGFGIGPQFVKGIAKDGVPQALFAVVQCVFSLVFILIAGKVAGYDMGSIVGLYAGSQTISASMGLGTDAINRLGMDAAHSSALTNAIPVAYAVTYIFGTIGSALILSQLGPLLLRIDLVKACKDYEARMGSEKNAEKTGPSWHEYVLRVYKVLKGNKAIGMTVKQLEYSFPHHRIFVEGAKRDGAMQNTTSNFVIQEGDLLAIGGDVDAIIDFFADDATYLEDEDEELLNQPIEGVDVYITNKAVDGRTLEDLADEADAHGVFLRRIQRGLAGTEIPILAKTKLNRGDVVTLTGLTKDVEKAVADLGRADRKTDIADVAMIGAAIFIGGIIGAAVVRVGAVPLTLSTAGGALIAGLVAGWLRSIHPTFGRIPEPTVWFMNSVGLNVFIAVVGLTAGPTFVAGLKELGLSLFLWGVFATSLPLIAGMFVAKYVFKFDPAILLGCCAGARTTTAALGMINEKAKSNVPSLGYTVTYAVGNTLLTIWGMVIILILS